MAASSNAANAVYEPTHRISFAKLREPLQAPNLLELQIRSFDGKDGQKRWVTEIIAQSVEFLVRRSAAPATATADGNVPHDAAAQFGQDVAPDDEIPF